jgi:hypothetical protein
MLAREYEHARGGLPRKAADGFDDGVTRAQVERDGFEHREHGEHHGQQTTHHPGGVVPAGVRHPADARREEAFDARDITEIDGQVFGRRREHAHAVTDGRQGVIAHQIKTSQREYSGRDLFHQQLRAADGDDVARGHDACARNGHAIDAHATFGRGIEQPAPGHGAQARWRRALGHRVVVVGADRSRRRIKHYARPVTRLVLPAAQNDRRVE